MNAEVQTTDIETKAVAISEEARALVIRGEAEYRRGGEIIVAIDGLRKEIDATFAPVIESAHKAHKAALAAKNRHDEPLASARTLIKGRLGAYMQEQERIRAEAARKAAEEARRAEEEARLRDAVAAEAAGETAAAEEILAAPVIAPVIAMPKMERPAPGVTFRTVWRFRITDPAALPREYLMPDESKIGSVVRALKADTKIAGVQVYAEKV